MPQMPTRVMYKVRRLRPVKWHLKLSPEHLSQKSIFSDVVINGSTVTKRIKGFQNYTPISREACVLKMLQHCQNTVWTWKASCNIHH